MKEFTVSDVIDHFPSNWTLRVFPQKTKEEGYTSEWLWVTQRSNEDNTIDALTASNGRDLCDKYDNWIDGLIQTL